MNRHLIVFNKKPFGLRYFIFLLFLFSISSSVAQPGFEKGLPFITNYSTKTYNGNAQNWSVVQDNNGIMYFGNNGSSGSSIAMTYDGVKWNSIKPPKNTRQGVARSLIKDKEGIIYFGGTGDFGFFGYDSLGQAKAFSLLENVPKDKRNFFDVWSSQITDEGIYFQSRERLFRLTKAGSGNNQHWISKTWEPATHFMYTFYLDGILYVHEQGIGLLKMVNDSLILIPGSEFLGKDRVQIMLPYSTKAEGNGSSQNEYLIGTMHGGFSIFDGKNFKPFKTEADNLFHSTLLYKGSKINGNYIIATTSKGLVVINQEGKLQQLVNRNSGLQSEIVYSIYQDNSGSLWLGLGNGISKVDINSPFTKFGIESGITSGAFAMARLPDGSLYVGTNSGLLKYNPSSAKFEPNVRIAKNQVFNPIVDGNTLLVPSDGLFLIKGDKTILVRPSIAGNLQIDNLYLSEKYPDVLFSGTSFGVTLFIRDPNVEAGWQYLGELPGIKEGIWSFAENKKGQVWAGTQGGTIYLITLSFDKNEKPDLHKTRVETLGKKQGYNIPLLGVFKLNNTIYFGSDSTTYTFNEKQKKFEKATFEGYSNFSGIEDSSGNILLGVGSDIDKFKGFYATRQPNGSFHFDSTSLLPIIDATFNASAFFDTNSIIWFLSNDGIVRYDMKIKENTDKPFKTLINKIIAEKQQLNPYEPSGSQPLEIKFNQNSLRFEYAAPFYDKEDKTQYQTRLEGFEKTWSDFGKNTYKEFTNLSPGKYIFHVRARNLYHKISEEATYSFIILAPWYSTWWAYLLYAIILLLIGFIILKWRTRQLKEKHRELEKTIDERTLELSSRVKELAVINNVQEGLVSRMDMQSIYDLVGEKLRSTFDAQVTIIGSFDDDGAMEHFNYVMENGKRYYPDSRPVDKLRKQLILSGQKIIIENIEQSQNWFGNKVAVKDSLPAKSAVFVPLLIGNNVKRYISLQNVDRENAFTDSDIRLLETLANSMSVALENARLFDETTRLLKETEQRTAELSVINSVQEGLAKELNMQTIYELVGDKLSVVMHTLDIDIRLFSPETNQVFYPYVRDKGEIIKVDPSAMRGMSKHVYETRQTLIINEKLEDRMKEMGSFTLPGTQMEKSFMAVPIIVGNKALGMVSISNYEKENAFSDSEARLLQTVVSAMSVALENARLFDETTRLLKETEQRTAELGVINSVQEGLVREMNIAAIYELVGERLCDLFPDTQTLVIRTFDLSKGIENWQFAIEKGDRLYSEPREINWLNEKLIASRKPQLINENFVEVAKENSGISYSIGEVPKSVIFVPMIVGDVVKGSVSLQNVDRENAFTDSDLRLLTTLTNSMSVALENARLFDETNHLLDEAKQRATELTTVNNISKALASKLNPNELIKLVGDQLRDLFRANIVYLALLDKKTGMIHFPYQFGEVMPSRKIGDGLTSKVIMTGEPLLINKDLSTKHEELGISQMGLPAASYIGVPIPEGDKIIGVLSVQSTERENRFNENDQRLLTTIASSVGVSLRNAQLFEEVEQAKMEAEKASKVAEKANEAKSAFLSTVSHELRTPLTSVLGFAKIISKRLHEKIFPVIDQSDSKMEKTVNQVNENLQVVISEGERLTHLINDVLDLAKIEAGRMEWNQETVLLPEVVDRAVSATNSLFDQKNIELVKQIDPDIPEIIGDPDKLIQVVINLFSNAVKFTDKGNVTCRVYKNENEVIVSVSDTGIGIAPEDFGAVFEQFKQVGGDTLTDKPKGTGLGLPICKEIVEHHGGRIWVESELKKGSTFSFAIPFTNAELDGVPKQKPIHLNELVKQLKEQMVFSQLKMDGKKSTILVVDDDDSIRSLLDQELSEAGYSIEQATNGKQALECIRNHRPDLIILDVMMPEMNGFDVAAILKNDPQTMDIPIIILSIVQDKSRGFRIGVDRYLTKPIDTTKLFTEIGNLLEQGKSKKKVMVVDEDSTAVRTLTEVLQTKGYQVVESDGKELVEKAIASQPDIIILNSLFSGNQEIVKTLRFEKGLENVLFFIYQ